MLTTSHGLHDAFTLAIPDVHMLLAREGDATPNRTLRGEVFLVRDVPVDQLTVTEGRLVIVAVDELEPIGDRLARPAQYALAIFLKRKRIT